MKKKLLNIVLGVVVTSVLSTTGISTNVLAYDRNTSDSHKVTGYGSEKSLEIKKDSPKEKEDNPRIHRTMLKSARSREKEKLQNTSADVKAGDRVNIKITDIDPDIRRGVDSTGQIVEKNGKKFVRIKYYSKNERVAGDVDNPKVYYYGLRNLGYAYYELKDGSGATLLEKKVVEKGKIQGGNYEVSETDIPIDGKDKVYLHAKVLDVNGEEDKFGTLKWEKAKNLPKPNETKVDAPSLLNVKQLGMNIRKAGDERLEFDFDKDGVIHSPYASKDGKKFKLSNPRYELGVYFKRDSLDNTKLRYIRYTLDGKEPTASSPAAGIGFINNSENILDSKFYDIIIDPLADVPNFTKTGGKVVLKVKGYNADNSIATETKEFTFDFDSYSLDEVDTKANIGDKTYPARLDTNKATALTEDVVLETGKVEEGKTRVSIEKEVKASGIKNAQLFKIRVVNSKGEVYKPYYKNEWEEDKNPLMRLGLESYPTNNNTAAFLYKDGELRPVATKREGKFFYMDINQQEGFYVIGTADGLLYKQVAKLEELIKKAEEKMKASSLSKERVIVREEVEEAKNVVKQRNKAKLDNTIRCIDNLERYMKNLDGAEPDKEYIKKKAKALIEIADQPILEKLFKTSDCKDVQNAKKELEKNISEKNINILEEKLDNMKYKGKNKEVTVGIHRYKNKDVKSMANGVLENTGRLIFMGDKTYLEMKLKTLKVLKIKAHYLNLSVFEDALDEGETFKVYSLGKFDAISRYGELKMFDKKILVELKGELKNFYNIRVDNDGMPGANPAAKLYISDVNGI